MAGKNFCELCGEAGLTSRLVPFQMNTDEAILICQNSECVFPLGTPRVGNFVLSRKATEISNIKRKRKKITLQNEPENFVSESKCFSNNKHENQEQFLNWENVDALCWLDSALSLLVHNQTLKDLICTIQSPRSLLTSVLEGYTRAQQLLPSNLPNAKKVLCDARHAVWTYLAPKMKCSLGVNDSPVFALPLLLRENTVTLENCLQKYAWEFRCDSCGFKETTRKKKYIVTFPNTPKEFNLQNGSFLKSCPNCNSVDQKSTIIHERVPDLVLMHFVEGFKSEDYIHYQFMFDNRIYKLTQFVQYSKNPDHFICWTKENNGTRWLELDDMKPPICSWSNSTPRVPPSEVHIVIFEKVSSKPCKSGLLESKMVKITDSLEGITTQMMTLSTSRVKEHSADNQSQNPREESISCQKDDGPCSVLLPSIGKSAETSSNDLDNSEIPLSCEGYFNERISSPKALPLDKTLIQQGMKQQQQENGFDQDNGEPKHGVPLIQQKPVFKDCLHPIPGLQKSDTFENFPLKDHLSKPENLTCLAKTADKTNTVLPGQKHSAHEKACTSSLSSPSYNPSSLENSLVKVTLKRHSASKKFQPLLNNKRRALSNQFQPYVPKKQRLEPQPTPKPISLDYDHQSDSGYSSPSSVSSCSSASSAVSIEAEQKMQVADDLEKMEVDDDNHESFAEELEKLLPDCLLSSDSKKALPDDDVGLNEAFELNTISQEQDDFIRNLFFND